MGWSREAQIDTFTLFKGHARAEGGEIQTVLAEKPLLVGKKYNILRGGWRKIPSEGICIRIIEANQLKEG